MSSYDSYEDAGIVIPAGVNSGEHSTICPQCFHDPEKFMDENLAVNLDKRTWYCHQCWWSDGLRKGGAYVSGNGRNRATRPATPVDKPDSDCKAECNRKAYAIAKRLPESFLEELRVIDCDYQHRPAIRIPYLNRDRTEGAVRYRIALTKDEEKDAQFRWKSKSRPCLYGLWRLQSDPVVLVEGESNCHTLWYHGFNAAGLPAASQWKDKRDAGELAECEEIFAVIEPNEGGQQLLDALSNSTVSDRVRIVRLEGDVSELHIFDPATFKQTFQEALGNALALSEELERLKRQASVEAFERCQHLARDPDILKRFAKDIRDAGLVGEERNAQIVYLAYVSRLLPKIVSVVVKGPSSGGKSFLVKSVSKFFPDSASYELSGMSEKALAYSEEPLIHRMLVIYEAAALDAEYGEYLLRSLLSEGRIRYETVEKVDGKMQTRLVEREGPTGLVITTTRNSLNPENETRMFTLTVTDTREQTRAIFQALANDDRREIDHSQWHALQTWLEGAGHQVYIPFAGILADLTRPEGVRMRRDFDSILSLIRASAILHQANRECDQEGRIIALLDDYKAVRKLVAPIVTEGVGAAVSKAVREAVSAIERLTEPDKHVGYKDVGQALNIDTSSAYRRVRKAIAEGYVINEQTKKGQPAILKVGDAMPEALELLPSVQRLHDCMQSEGDIAPPLPEEDFDEA